MEQTAGEKIGGKLLDDYKRIYTSGKAPPGSRVTVTLVDNTGRSVTLGPVVADSMGNYSVTPPTPLTPGPYIATAVSTK